MNASSSNNIAISNKEYLITKSISYIELIKDFTTQKYHEKFKIIYFFYLDDFLILFLNN